MLPVWNPDWSTYPGGCQMAGASWPQICNHTVALCFSGRTVSTFRERH